MKILNVLQRYYMYRKMNIINKLKVYTTKKEL